MCRLGNLTFWQESQVFRARSDAILGSSCVGGGQMILRTEILLDWSVVSLRGYMNLLRSREHGLRVKIAYWVKKS